MRERALARHHELVITLGQEAEGQGLTEEQLLADLEDAKRQVFADTYGHKPD